MEWCQLLYARVFCPGLCHWNRTLISLLVTDARGSRDNGLETSQNRQLVSDMPNAWTQCPMHAGRCKTKVSIENRLLSNKIHVTQSSVQVSYRED